MDQVVGVIGLGAMGLPMATRLARAGFRLAVFDVNPAAAESVRAEGAVEAAADPQALVEASDILLTCLPNPRVVEAVYAEVAKPGLLACDCSTVGPRLAMRLHDRLAARGVRYLECPMLGAPAQAADGTLFLILSGDEAAPRELQPILDVLSRGQRYVGGPGQASLIKVVQNGLGLVQAVAIGEALSVLAKAGADLKTFCEVVAEGHGMADTPLFRAKAKAMLRRSRRSWARFGSAPRTSASPARWPPRRASRPPCCSTRRTCCRVPCRWASARLIWQRLPARSSGAPA